MADRRQREPDTPARAQADERPRAHGRRAGPWAEPAEPGRAFTDQLSMDDAIRRAFARLDPDKRAILVLHHVEERPVAEIASLLAIPEGTAKSRLHAAREALGRALRAEL